MNTNYRIGVGLLIEDEAFNRMRFAQMGVARATGVDFGLLQPPHITVVRPFEVEEIEDIYHVVRTIESASKEFYAKDIDFSALEAFGNSTLYFKPDEISFLNHMHLYIKRQIFRDVTLKDSSTVDGRELIFHSTIAYKLNDLQFKKGQIWLGSQEGLVPIHAHLRKIGLFLQVNGQWIVIHTVILRES